MHAELSWCNGDTIEKVLSDLDGIQRHTSMKLINYNISVETERK